MKVKFNTSVACSILNQVFTCSETYEIYDNRAKDFIKSKVAEEVKEEKVKKTRSKKTLVK